MYIRNGMGIEWTGYDDLIAATPTIAETYFQEEVVEPQKEAAVAEVQRQAATARADVERKGDEAEARVKGVVVLSVAGLGLVLWWLLKKKR